MANLVTLKALADELGCDRSAFLKWSKGKGVQWERRCVAGTRGQKCLTLSHEAADELRGMHRAHYDGGLAVTEKGEGFFYVIRLVPDLAPGRVKLGYAAAVGQRLAEHRCAAPTAALVKCWPSRKVWEPAAICSLTREGCSALSNECFDCEDVPALLARGDAFFALMPAP